jgi:hypothetical protein
MQRSSQETSNQLRQLPEGYRYAVRGGLQNAQLRRSFRKRTFSRIVRFAPNRPNDVSERNRSSKYWQGELFPAHPGDGLAFVRFEFPAAICSFKRAGHSETLNAYLKAIGRFHRYSLHNVMLIASQKPNASHVAGLRTWNQLDRSVKKGEKGIVILAPVLRRKEEKNEEPTESTSTIAGFRAAYVFRPSACRSDEETRGYG